MKFNKRIFALILAILIVAGCLLAFYAIKQGQDSLPPKDTTELSDHTGETTTPEEEPPETEPPFDFSTDPYEDMSEEEVSADMRQKVPGYKKIVWKVKKK